MKYRTYKNIVMHMVVACILFMQVTAQENLQTIDVPDVSTAIGGESQSIDENAIPDFTLILPEAETDFLLTLELPDENELGEAGSDAIALEEKSRFSLEGKIGGGYPGYFLGDINITQYNDENPFKVQFSHVTQNGLGRHLPSDGYTKSETFLFGESTFIFNEQYSLQVSAQYETGSTGFQNNSPLFYLSSNQDVRANAQFDIVTQGNWQIGLFADADLMNRFLGHKTDTPLSITTNSNAFGLDAGISFGKVFEPLSFASSFAYNFFSLDESLANRIDLDIGFLIPMGEYLKLDSSIGLVYEESLNVPVLVPFSLAFNYIAPSFEASISGGMTSEQINYADLQKKYPFTHIAKGISERAQWYSSIDMNVPFTNASGFSLVANFEKTAFSHGYILPDYENENSASGLYEFIEKDMILLDTDISATTSIGVFGFLAGWRASWLDVLPEENAHEVYVSASATSDKNDWGAQFTIVESFFGDYVPNFGLTAFFNVSPVLQLELQLEDFVKLVTGADRTFAGKYVTNSSFVGLFARLYL